MKGETHENGYWCGADLGGLVDVLSRSYRVRDADVTLQVVVPQAQWEQELDYL